VTFFLRLPPKVVPILTQAGPRLCGLSFNTPGNILISDQFNNRIIELNPKTGKIVWSFGDGSSTAGPTSVVARNDAPRVGDLTVIAGPGAPAARPQFMRQIARTGAQISAS
jgi:hypothetical protein